MDREVKITITPEGLVTIKLSHFSDHDQNVFIMQLSDLFKVPIEKIIDTEE